MRAGAGEAPPVLRLGVTAADEEELDEVGDEYRFRDAESSRRRKTLGLGRKRRLGSESSETDAATILGRHGSVLSGGSSVSQTEKNAETARQRPRQRSASNSSHVKLSQGFLGWANVSDCSVAEVLAQVDASPVNSDDLDLAQEVEAAMAFSMPIDEHKPKTQNEAQMKRQLSTGSVALVGPADAKKTQRRRTRIICAIGPASRDVPILLELLHAGMNVARLNFSHGDHSYHAQTLANIKEAVSIRESQGVQCHCAILMDTKGPEIRTGYLKDHKPVELKTGQRLEITTDFSILGDSTIIACSYKDLCNSVDVGGQILIADGSIQTRIIEVNENSVIVEVENNAILEERKNMNLPGVTIRLPGITEKDQFDLSEFALNNPVDIVSGSFIRSAANVRAIRECLGEKGRHIRIHAKIESVEALRNLPDIIEEADGIHVSRGDLGMELPLPKLFLAQKAIIRLANLAGKPVVTSTQMLDSMTTRPRPTNAECSDVANAVLDGTDSVMLSAETAKGLYPKESVIMMGRIIAEAERVIDYEEYYSTIRDEVLSKGNMSIMEAIGSTAVEVSIDVDAVLIVLICEKGELARQIAKYRPLARILVVTGNQATARQMSVSRGVSVMFLETARLFDTLAAWLEINKYIIDKGWAPLGAKVCLVMSLVDINEDFVAHLKANKRTSDRLCNVVEVREVSLEAYSFLTDDNNNYLGT